MSTDLAGYRVLVTGARGFVGRHVAAALLARGARVTGSSRADVPPGEGGLEWRRCDLADADATHALVRSISPDWIVHLSSLADGRRDQALVIPTFRSETVAAVHLLDAAATCGVRRIVLPASIEEPAPGEIPVSPYGAAKTATHMYARMFHRLYGTPVVMARIFMAYGPGQPEWKLIPAIARRALQGHPPAIESPDRLLDWIYIDDVADGLIASLLATGVEGGVVDIGSGQLTAIRDLAGLICRLAGPGVSPRLGEGQPRGDSLVRRADLGATRASTGWGPVVGLEEGLSRTLQALRAG